MITIALVNSKGGVGKSTLAAALAVRCARDSRRVAIVDLDPQQSIAEWWERRGRTDNPRLFVGAENAPDAIEALELDGWDWIFIDTPPAIVRAMQETIEAVDFAIVPVKASTIDLLATQDAVAFAREAGTAYLVVFNDCAQRERLVDKAREFLVREGVPVAETQIAHRVSHVTAMTVGKSAAEVNGGKDAAAAAEIDALWAEIKRAAAKAAKAKRKGGRNV
jgi:chromosome partitioning protein